MLDLRTLLREAGRRRVARVAVIYAAVAVALLEVSDIVIPALELPESAIRWVIAFSLLGFPVALVLAWVYDVTPRGVVRTPAAGEVQAGEGVPGRPSSVLLPAVLLLASGALLLGAAWFAFHWSLSSEPEAPLPGAGMEELDPRSIAVLPFSELDPEGQDGFFASGIHEDVLNHLSKIRSLRVISRTTVLQYRDTNKSAREIGRELGVGSLLEGSVRRQEGRIRVVAQLIDTRTDSHIWSESYDREETDIFQVQSEIAQEIARALQAELSLEELEQIQTTFTGSVAAYDRYLEGQLHWDRREERGEALRAVALFQEAVAGDPDFAVAHAALAHARMWLFWNFPGFQGEAERAWESLERALALAPGAVETRLAQGYFYYYGRGDAQEALRHFVEAERLKPSDAGVIAALGMVLRGEGRWDEAVEAFQRALSLDPLSYNLTFTLAETLARMRRYEQAERYLVRASSLAPGVAETHRLRLRVRLAATGDTVSARALLEGLPPGLSPRVREGLEAELAFLRRDYRGSLRHQEGPGGRNHERLAFLYHLLGEEPLKRAHADSLRAASQEVLGSVRANPGPVQTGVQARAHAKLGIANALLGDWVPAVVEASSAASLLPVSVDAFQGTEHLRDLALVYLLIGEEEMALQQLEGLLSVPSTLSVRELRLNPLFDPLRGHPGFRELLAGAG